MIISRKVFQYIYECCVEQGSQKHGQKGRESDLLVSISFLGAQSNSTKRPSHFLPLKIFRFVTLPLEIPDKAKLHPASLWKFQGQKQKPMEIPHDFVLISPGNSTFFN